MSTNYIAPIWRMPRNANKDKLSNYSIKFGTTNQVINFDSYTLPDKYTISIWLNPDASYGTDYGYYIGSTSGGTGFAIGQGGNAYGMQIGELYFFFGGSTSTLSGVVLPQNEWSHVLLVVDKTFGSQGKIETYLNNNLESTTTSFSSTPVSSFTSISIIGANTSNASQWDFSGEISQCCIFDYNLNVDQRTYIYNLDNPMAITGGEPVVYWPLGDNSNPNAPGSFPNISTGTDSVFDFTPNQYMNIGDSNLFSFGDSVNDFPFSISGWFYFDATGSYGLVAKYGTTSTSREWMLYTTGSNFRLLLYDTNGQNAYADASDTTIVANKWYHVVATYNGAGNVPGAREGIQIYVNGQPETMTRAGGTGYVAMHNTGRRVDLGSRSNTSYFDGQMSNVQIWDVELSAPNALELYNNGQPLMTGTQPQEANLLTWYKLNQSANWEADTVGNWQIPDNRSAYPQSFNFDGSSDKITLPSTLTSLGISTEFTVSAWFKSTNLGIYDTIINAPTTATAWNSGFGFQIVNSKLRFWVNEWSTANYFTESSTLSANTWYHAVGTFSSTNGIRLYFEGELVDTATNNVLDGLTNTMTIGASITSYYFDGKISNVQIWNTELPATGSNSVETLYNNGVPLITAIASDNLKAWYKLDNTDEYLETYLNARDNWVVKNNFQDVNYNSALYMNGTNSHRVSVDSSTNLEISGSHSFSFWVFYDDYSATSYIFDKGGLDYAFQIAGTSPRIIYYGYTRSGGGSANHITLLPGNWSDIDNAWHHVVLTTDISNKIIRYYLDGEEQGTGFALPSDFEAVRTSSGKLTIMTYGGGSYPSRGLISNFAIYNGSVLSPSEVTALYNNGTPEATPSASPTSWWKLNNLTTGLIDNINGDNATNTGSTVKEIPVQTTAGVSSGMTEQNLVNNNVSVLNGESSNMNTTNLVQSNLTRTQPYSNYSIQFDAAGGDYARTTAGSNSILSGSTSFTISAWVNFADTSSLRPIVTNWEAGTTSYNYIFRYNSGQLQLYVRANGASGNAAYAFTPTLNTWYNVVGTWGGLTGGTIQLYVNGAAVGTPGSRTGTMPTITVSDNIGLYTASGTNYYMDGRLSNIAYWKNSLLSEDDILNIYNNGITQDLNNFRITPTNWFPIDESYTYFNGTSLILRDAIAGRDATGFNIVQENIVGNAPGSEASGTGSNLTITDLKGNMYNSDKNAYSINMADYADGVTNPANSGRSTDTP